jgi:hypothetical protein
VAVSTEHTRCPHDATTEIRGHAFARYFAVDGFSYGSTTSNWQGMMASMVAAGKMFVPSVGPVRVRAASTCATVPS